jgi:hypothetical protein
VLSSFESWSAAVGSVLRFAGLTDFLGNEDRKRDLAEDDSNLEREILLTRQPVSANERVTRGLTQFLGNRRPTGEGGTEVGTRSRATCVSRARCRCLR